VKSYLEVANKLAKEGNKTEARRRAYEVQLLYDNRPEVQDEVDEAKKLIEELRK